MEANVIYSKIADSHLPSEIQGEEGTIVMNHISRLSQVTFIPRIPQAVGGQGEQPAAEDWTQPMDKDRYYYEVAEFIDLVLSGRRESAVNTHCCSLMTMELMDEVRRQLGVVYPADEQ